MTIGGFISSQLCPHITANNSAQCTTASHFSCLSHARAKALVQITFKIQHAAFLHATDCCFLLQIRKTLYDTRATLDQYGIPVGTVIDTISAARGMLSAAADSSMNSADEGITTDVVSHYSQSSYHGAQRASADTLCMRMTLVCYSYACYIAEPAACAFAVLLCWYRPKSFGQNGC